MRAVILHNGTIGLIIRECDGYVTIRDLHDRLTISKVKKPHSNFDEVVKIYMNQGYKLRNYYGNFQGPCSGSAIRKHDESHFHHQGNGAGTPTHTGLDLPTASGVVAKSLH